MDGSHPVGFVVNQEGLIRIAVGKMIQKEREYPVFGSDT